MRHCENVSPFRVNLALHVIKKLIFKPAALLALVLLALYFCQFSFLYLCLTVQFLLEVDR